MINWNISKQDLEEIELICKKGFSEMLDVYSNVLAMSMDITAVHLNGCPLRLSELRNADDSNFYHDLYGIASNINRETGKLENCFLPRYSRPERKVSGND